MWIRKIMKSLNLKNKKFGNLLIVKRIGSKNGHALWLCKCDCGNFKRLITGELRTKRGTKSCGCSKKRIYSENKNWKGFGEISGKYFNRIIKECSRGKRKISFKITIKQIWNLFLIQKRKCALTGKEIYFGIRSNDERTASLDRIDSKKGYTVDNVQWVHKDVNNMKQDYDQKYFIEICKLISRNN